MPAPGMLTPFSVPGKKSFFAVPPPGKPLEFPFFVLGWKGACLVLNPKGQAPLCSLGRSQRCLGTPFNRQALGRACLEALTWGRVASLGLGGKGDQGQVVSGKQSAGSGAWGWVSPAGAGGNPPTFAAPPGGALKKGNFPFTFSLFFSLAKGRFYIGSSLVPLIATLFTTRSGLLTPDIGFTRSIEQENLFRA